MNKEHGAVFRQSLRDIPCPVTLGKNTPSFGLHRFKQGLRFVPPDDEGFTLRGDKQRLLYKGRWRSHRFTILGDTAFEYDCILEREPESNVITLQIIGAENFDFFRQPDFVSDPFLKGSYAVYKKDTLVGEGTGKLCHIHRPLIIDARGRRCWGKLAVVGNELRITIPEKWLADAQYPVIVDPTIGTATVGSQYKHIWDVGEPAEPLMFEGSIAVNRFLVSETINGLCTAYFYTNDDDGDAGCRPVLYSDNGNSPLARRSTEENFVSLRVTSGNPKGWRSATFKSNTAISNGSYIWFGAFVDFFWFPRFDYGAKCYIGNWYDVGDSIPNTFPMYNVNWYEDFKLSMYFTYSSAQNHVRVLTQGVKLTDNRKLTENYKRTLTQTAGVNSVLSKIASLFRKCVITAQNETNIKRLSALKRNLGGTIGSIAETKHKAEYYRFQKDTVQAAGVVFRGLLLFVRIVTKVFIRDYFLGRFLKAREELILKSAVCREIILESRIN